LPEYYWLFLFSLLIIAYVFASVGYGGASGYLALMALFVIEPAVMRPSALTISIFVAAVSFYQFYRRGHFNLGLFVPFALGSAPMAFVGGSIGLDPYVYNKLLALGLVFAVIHMVFFSPPSKVRNKKMFSLSPFTISWGDFILALVIGGLLGLFSGLIGIGGGIILSPVILLLGWGNLKETAAVSSLFILFNSLAGLSGYVNSGAELHSGIWQWIVVAFIGGMVGSYIGASRMADNALKWVLSAVLVFAMIKLGIG